MKVNPGRLAIGSVLVSQSGRIIVGAHGTLTGAGTLAGDQRETAGGQVIAKSGTLSIVGHVTVGGTLTIKDAGTLELSSANANTVSFAQGHGVLRLVAPGKFSGDITGLSAGDTIDLPGVKAVSADLPNGVLTVTGSHGGVYALHVAGALTGNAFTFVSDGKDGTNPVLRPKGNPILPADRLIFSEAALAYPSVPGDGALIALSLFHSGFVEAAHDLLWA